MKRVSQVSHYEKGGGTELESPACKKAPKSTSPGNEPTMSINEGISLTDDGFEMESLRKIEMFPPMTELKKTLPKPFEETTDTDATSDVDMTETPSTNCPHANPQVCRSCNERTSCDECQTPILDTLSPEHVELMRGGVFFRLCYDCCNIFISNPELAFHCDCHAMYHSLCTVCLPGAVEALVRDEEEANRRTGENSRCAKCTGDLTGNKGEVHQCETCSGPLTLGFRERGIRALGDLTELDWSVDPKEWLPARPPVDFIRKNLLPGWSDHVGR